ncbi:sensor histidine kinase [Kibdelosporangium aridum]|uniref:histidine kinase n=1 Tax=Kibdelosporangium aridum TaxID=2030 RepID=A0A1W2FXY0_KIBAR|nr:histidine kinase [Kibdelosporangium aridum]SMD26751.1 Signal transduction histidine kinase [Kibdelosporangium aridum]
MSGAHALARAPRLAPWAGALGRELVLLAFIGALTYLAVVYGYINVEWSPAECDNPAVTALVVAGAVVPALLRRRFPATALLAAALLFAWYPATGATLALTSYTVASRIGSVRRRVATLAMGATVPFSIALICSRFQWQTTVIAFGVAALVCVLGPATVQVLLGQREQLIGALREQTRYAKLQERSRIAQEMHDLLGHRLSLISLYAGSLELDGTQASEPARLIRGTAKTAMDELRATLGMLRHRNPVTTQPNDHTGTWSDISQLITQAQAAGVKVELTWEGADLTGTALPIRQAVHRIVREGLTNVSRHAAGAPAKVSVAYCPDRVRVEVIDAGHPGGTGQPGSGLGLVGVKERVRLLGGTCHAGPMPAGGFRITADLPPVLVPPAPDNDEKTDDRWARAGMSAVLAIGLVAPTAILSFTFGSVTFDPIDDPQEVTFESIPIGAPRATVVEFIGQDDPLARTAATAVESARPPGSDCWYSAFSEDAVIERFCFQQDVLIDKARFGFPAG